MRVITGTARGANLYTLEGNDVRPTAERVKEALFSVIQFHIPGARVLDLFAGSGQLGIEALSRGASSAVFVDGSDDSIQVIRKNLSKTKFTDKAKVVKSDAFRYLARADGMFDVIFIDPPYHLDLAKKAVRRASDVLSEGGFLVCETERNVTMPEEAGEVVLNKSYQYGQTCIWVYRNREEGEEAEE